jgi:hypothetical protein
MSYRLRGKKRKMSEKGSLMPISETTMKKNIILMIESILELIFT